ncbi:MAG: cyclodeaminase/cyclohydrolase family protein [Planctomycetota bacterium]|jgi:formiminotetrahydrofolate cyclodeaminase
MYCEERFKKYLDDLAAKKPALGGSAAAAVGALRVSLLNMAANFTIGKEKYKGV